jgi:hypothetical protein
MSYGRRSRTLAALATGSMLALQFTILVPAAHAAVTLSGPGAPIPAPNGGFTSNVCTNAFTANAPCEGQAGGRTWTFTGINTTGYTHLYWGPYDSSTATKTPVMSMDGSADGTGEARPMVGATLIASNVARWTGSARVFLCSTGSCVSTTKNTRFTLTTKKVSDGTPIAFVSGTSQGLPATVPFVIPVSVDFTANFLYEVEDPVGTWTPAVTWYNNAPTPAPADGSPKGTITGFNGSWYWNRVPGAAAMTPTTNEDTPLNLSLAGSDPDGNALSYEILSGPSSGLLTPGSGAARTYLPPGDFNGTDSFTYRTNDGAGNSAPATVTLTVNPVNDAPLATAQSVSLLEDATLDVTLAGTDVEGDALTYEVVTPPASGLLNVDALPTVTYSPGLDFNGGDSFTFRANDGTEFGPEATVNITVDPVNDAPTADDQTVGTPEDVELDITVAGGDVDGDALDFLVIDQPLHGTLSGAGANLHFVPELHYNGLDAFTFVSFDGEYQSNLATVTIEIPAVNDAPETVDAAVETDEDVAAAITLTSTDVDDVAEGITYEVVSGPSNGTLSGDAPNLTYTPNEHFHGADEITFKANDGEYDSNVSAIAITVNSVNDAPTADDLGSVVTAEDNAIDITLTGADLDGDEITFTVTDAPDHGTLSGDAPNLTYTPDLNYNGADTFAFVTNDGELDSNVANVSIDVTPVNDQPVAHAQSLGTSEDGPLLITLTGEDIEESALTFTVVDGPSNGTLEGTGSERTYTANPDYHGSDGFTFLVNDGELDSELVTVTIEVGAVNDAPVALDDAAATPQYTSVTVSVLPNDSDVDGDIPSIVSATDGAAGSTTVNEDGTITYAPTPAFKDGDQFTYTIGDGNGATDTATVTITEIGCGEDGPASRAIDREVEPRIGDIDADTAATVHANNCALVVPAEDLLPEPAGRLGAGAPIR